MEIGWLDRAAGSETPKESNATLGGFALSIGEIKRAVLRQSECGFHYTDSIDSFAPRSLTAYPQRFDHLPGGFPARRVPGESRMADRSDGVNLQQKPVFPNCFAAG